MTPDEFIAKWSESELKESQASQSHFNDLCRMLDEPTPDRSRPHLQCPVPSPSGRGPEPAPYRDTGVSGHSRLGSGMPDQLCERIRLREWQVGPATAQMSITVDTMTT